MGIAGARDRLGVSGRSAAEPDAVRVSCAVPEGAGAGAVGQRGTRCTAAAWVRVCCGDPGFVLGAGGRAAGIARSGRSAGMGIPVPVAGISVADGRAAVLPRSFAGGPIRDWVDADECGWIAGGEAGIRRQLLYGRPGGGGGDSVHCAIYGGGDWVRAERI